MKYSEWLVEWLELYEKPSVKKRTYDQYSDVVKRRLLPSLGDYDMDDLDARTLQRYFGIIFGRKHEKRKGTGSQFD